MSRDIKGDYQRAYTEEYESYRRAGRTEDAERVAGILRDHFDVTVDEDAAEDKDAGGKSAPERADAGKPPENTVPPKPARAKRPQAKKPDGE